MLPESQKKLPTPTLYQWQVYSLSSLFILDVVTKSQKDHKLFKTTCILLSRKMATKKKMVSILKITMAAYILNNQVIYVLRM